MKDLDFNRPFALVKRKGEREVIFLQGQAIEVDKLADIPRKNGIPEREIFDTISIIPFSQIKERNFFVHDDGAKIKCIQIETQQTLSLNELLLNLPTEKISLQNEVKYNFSRDEYEKIIQSVITDEIGNGEGANFVIPRVGKTKILNMSVNVALSLYKSILSNELGAYWFFLFYDGERFFIGATPERHVSVYKKKVRMNPISGTFRKNETQYADLKVFKQALLNFLVNPKEINELFMVVDEELKMMARICNKGGMIVGPLLKEMSRLIHTEYLLSGLSDMDIIDILRESMYAATVTGSPVENACRIIHKYETEARRYYASALALIGRDTDGEDFLDSPITIRTLEIDLTGNVLLRVGGTLVRDSIPSEEVRETESKMSAMLRILQNQTDKAVGKTLLSEMEGDDDIHEILQLRNQYLSKFWFFNQSDTKALFESFSGKQILIIENGDDFCFMIQHIINKMGIVTRVVNFADYDFAEDDSDLTIVGPGPGNPVNLDDKKMATLTHVTKILLNARKPFLSVCLGHQILCKILGFEILRKENPFQGVQENIDFFGQMEKVGFYNTFVGKYAENVKFPTIASLEVAHNKSTQEIHALRSERFYSFQFHPESILTQNGFLLLYGMLGELLLRDD